MWSGRDPTQDGVASGSRNVIAVYRSHSPTEKLAADVADVTPVTLRTTVKALR